MLSKFFFKGSQSKHLFIDTAGSLRLQLIQQLLAIHFMKENHFPLKRQADRLLLETGATNTFKISLI